MNAQRQLVVAMIAMIGAFYFTFRSFNYSDESMPPQVEKSFDSAKSVLKGFARSQPAVYFIDGKDGSGHSVFTLLEAKGDSAPLVLCTLKVEQQIKRCDGVDGEGEKEEKEMSKEERKAKRAEKYRDIREKMRQDHREKGKNWINRSEYGRHHKSRGANEREKVFSVVFYHYDARLDEFRDRLRPFLVQYTSGHAAATAPAMPRSGEASQPHMDEFRERRRVLQEELRARRKNVAQRPSPPPLSQERQAPVKEGNTPNTDTAGENEKKGNEKVEL
eukprot:CAMPEP_0113877344 /NCGR_PEP_ID=MMETSP0780_2-20120614/6041_1 /TAXON_ID=652834 /ORGANISM="Palpitomonas bilix" /LENGTH=274 /DNA_ID=CAMNT_0000863625 /DNA_START=175 /DNA_END=999 /DNA_ORIENTATION=- /assembly_acc=CAM_ASM_000599